MSRFQKNSASASSWSLVLGVVCALCAVAVVCPSSAHADFLVTLGGADQVITDDGFDLLHEDSFLVLSNIGLSWEVIPGLRVGGEYQGASLEYSAFSSLNTDVSLMTWMATSRLEYPWKEYARPYLGVGAGLNFAWVTADIASQEREQNHILPTAYGVGGFEILVPRTWLREFFEIQEGQAGSDFTLGLSMELGYQWVAEMDLDDLEVPEPDKEPEPEDRPLDTDPVSLGGVSLSGMMMRFALQVHF